MEEKGGEMKPEREWEANGHVVEEFYWNGKMIVYVDNKKVSMTFSEAKKFVDKISLEER